ncbi:MAG: sulfurtransferase, partial [Candidatus Eremiobacteraeota bacterium]|nr:sulfurtransferase [Candidatus Eremiobacteraeota bacterium]
MKDVTVEELARWRREGKDFVLLDVRDPYEIAAASLPESVIIPMREIPSRMNELPDDKPIAVLCHHGGRSERVAQFLEASGFANVHNVSGG